MGALFKLLGHFLTRDALYIVGGFVVIFSFVHGFGLYHEVMTSMPFVLLLVGLAYAIGYASQTALAVLRLVCVRRMAEPDVLTRWLYHGLERKPWEPLQCDEHDLNEFELEMYASEDKAIERKRSEYNRIIHLKHIGTGIGSGCIVAAPLLLVKAIHDATTPDWALAIADTVLGVVLISFARIHAAQQARYLISIMEPEILEQAPSASAPR